MDRLSITRCIRQKLANGGVSIGSWMQVPHSSIAEIMGQGGYDWVSLDLEHGSVSLHQLPDLCRALELGGTLPLVRVAEPNPKDCKQALDAGAGGIIAPMIETMDQLKAVRDACRWPPAGGRGVGFSRANLFGKNFEYYALEAQAPLLVPMIESVSAVQALEMILSVEGVDAILIGPYDLSASLGLTGEFEHPEFCRMIDVIRNLAEAKGVPVGFHLVEPSSSQLMRRIGEGYRFIAYSIDAVMLEHMIDCDLLSKLNGKST